MGAGRPGSGTKRFRHLLELCAVAGFGFLLRTLPYRWAVNLAEFLGRLAFDLFRIRRKVTLSNLHLAFGKEKSLAELKKIGRRSYQIIARSFGEHLYLPKLDKAEISNLVEFNSLEPFHQALNQGKGAVLASAHFGSWQLFGVAVAQAGLPVNFLVQEQRNVKVDQLAYQYVQDKGVGVLYRKFSARKVLELLKQNEFVAMLPDQDAGRNGIIVKFFGHPVSVHKGPAYFAIRTKTPIITGFIVQNQTPKLRAYIQDPYYPSLTGDQEKDAEIIMQKITSQIEEFVRKYPEHWFWPHRRWKSTLPNHAL